MPASCTLGKIYNAVREEIKWNVELFFFLVSGLMIVVGGHLTNQIIFLLATKTKTHKTFTVFGLIISSYIKAVLNKWLKTLTNPMMFIVHHREILIYYLN